MAEIPKLYVGIAHKDEVPLGHTVCVGKPLLFEDWKKDKKKAADPQPDTLPAIPALTFSEVFRSFTNSMESYRNFIALTLEIAPYLSTAIAASEIKKFASAKGQHRPELSSATTTVYELEVGCLREYEVCESKVQSAMIGTDHLPEAMIIGLVSVYDAFLSRLLRVVFNLHPEIVLTSEKEIKFSELVKFSSIESARNSLIDREIDAVLRMSHHEQFDWMQQKFKLPLKVDLPIWPKFVELCERRNLLTHTGGIVSPQYIDSGQKHKFDVSKTPVGTKLEVKPSYYKAAVSIIYEIGIKLCSVFWRKFLDPSGSKRIEH